MVPPRSIRPATLTNGSNGSNGMSHNHPLAAPTGPSRSVSPPPNGGPGGNGSFGANNHGSGPAPGLPAGLRFGSANGHSHGETAGPGKMQAAPLPAPAQASLPASHPPMSAPPAIGRPVFAPPGIPDERLQALRTAFDETMKDPAFLAEAQLEGLDIEPVNGTELQKIVTDILTSPASVRDRLSKIIELPQQWVPPPPGLLPGAPRPGPWRPPPP